ncbi:cytochrome b [Ehrlichia ruminantium]|uniref:Cytochrome b n=1 Tax=Ehrlichia ruminantium TaxID=779 RepID=A0AAE6UJC3_EHRRU|nr:cytochrome b [Ehrlichia ruminantium]QGR02239.1 cytochrome b [Ehrlichia ruminantium]QGR03161.1 cytochrome b [Ehrlichia ruminantium]QGR04086.1 cytochrome b [Ehrlichia ruminantium]
MKEKYHYSVRIMHWLTGIPIILMLILGFWMKSLPNTYPVLKNIYILHKSIGIILLALLLLRVMFRTLSVIPPYYKGFPNYLAIISKITHVSLYILSITMATSGYVMSSASGRAIQIFSLNVPLLIDINENIAIIAKQCHNVCAYMLSVTIILHILAVLKHKFIDKDNIFNRII